MALSDYLTSDEWDACFYAYFGQHHTDNFGVSMRTTIDALLEAGHRFSGLDESGNKSQQVGNGVNAPKLLIFTGNPCSVDVLTCLDSGRRFLKEKLPSLVDESDEEWAEELAKLEEDDG